MNENVSKLLESLAERLGVGVETLWEALVSYQVFRGIELAFWMVVSVGLWWALRLWLRKGREFCEAKVDDACPEIPHIVCLVAGGILTLIVTVGSWGQIGLALACFFAPEAAALQQLLEAVKG